MRVIPIVIMLTVLLGTNYYVFYRLWQMMPVSTLGRVLLIIAGIIAFVSPFLSILLGSHIPAPVTTFMYKVGTSWLIIFLYLLITFLVLDLVRITHLLPVGKIMYHSWYGLGGLTLLMTVLMLWGYVRYIHKDRVELAIPVDKVMKTGSGLKIVAVSDLHLGYGIGKKELAGWVDMINKENPDVLLIAGDLIDNNTKPLYDQKMMEELKQIKTRYGIYAVFGNHEYISNASKSSRFYADAGINLLRDSVVLVDDLFYIAGRDDRSNPERKTTKELVGSLDHTKPVILLDHQPYHLEESEQNNIDLQLSGHTHDGQVWPISIITNHLYEKSHGYIQKGNSHIYVSSGLGLWGGKFRIGTRSEYIVIQMKTKE